jgi:cullin 1
MCLQDRYHLKYHHLPPLEEAGLGHFKTIVFDAVKINLADAIIELIDREQEGIAYIANMYSNMPYSPVTQSLMHFNHLGGIINRYLVLSTVQIYEKMGMGELDVYHRADLEQRLLEDTRSGHHNPIVSWLCLDIAVLFL